MSRYWSKFSCLKGGGSLWTQISGERGVPTNDVWHQKSRVPGLSYGEKNAEKFNRLSRVHQRHRRQTTDRQRERRWHIANVMYTIMFANKTTKKSDFPIFCIWLTTYVVTTDQCVVKGHLPRGCHHADSTVYVDDLWLDIPIIQSINSPMAPIQLQCDDHS